MADRAQRKARILASGALDDAAVEQLRREVYATGQVHREEVEFLIELRHEAQVICPSFERLFFQALREALLAGGVIDVPETRWLRHLLFADGTIDESEKKFLRQLKSEAEQFCPEFQALYDECMQ